MVFVELAIEPEKIIEGMTTLEYNQHTMNVQQLLNAYVTCYIRSKDVIWTFICFNNNIAKTHAGFMEKYLTLHYQFFDRDNKGLMRENRPIQSFQYNITQGKKACYKNLIILSEI